MQNLRNPNWGKPIVDLRGLQRVQQCSTATTTPKTAVIIIIIKIIAIIIIIILRGNTAGGFWKWSKGHSHH